MSDFSDLRNDGVPVGHGPRFSSPWAAHYFIDQDNGSDDNPGTEPGLAKKTIQGGVDVLSAQDVAYIRPRAYQLGQGFRRYQEDVTIAQGGGDASGEVVTNAGISLIGVTSTVVPSDYGGVRWKHSSSFNLTVQAPGVHIENLGFFSEGATYGVLLDSVPWTTQGSIGFSIYNCAFKGKGLYILSGGDGVSIDKCRFQSSAGGVVAQINASGSANPGRRLAIRNCEWMGGNATGMDGICIQAAAPWTETIIRDCVFGKSAGGVYIQFAGSTSTGHIANCYFAIADISTTAIVEGGLIATGIYDGGGLATST